MIWWKRLEFFLLILLFSNSIFLSCGASEDPSVSDALKRLPFIDSLGSSKNYVLVDFTQGCSGCIHSAISYFSQNEVSDHQELIILTRGEGYPEMFDTLKAKENVHIVEDKNALKFLNDQKYPVVVPVDSNGKLLPLRKLSGRPDEVHERISDQS